MGGNRKCSKDRLNFTLKTIAELLHKNNIEKWFVSYGSLLGIIREDSCIEGDDDVDIILSTEYYDKIKQILPTIGINRLSEVKTNFIKTNLNHPLFASVDFYFSKIDQSGNFDDTWNGVVWSECYINNEKNDFIIKDWNETKLHLPNNYETKLFNRYGDNWRTPQKSKGRKPQLKKI